MTPDNNGWPGKPGVPLEEAALRLEELHKNHKYNPETGEGSEHDVGYYRALSEGAAWIRALDPVASKSAANLVAQARQSALEEAARLVETHAYTISNSEPQFKLTPSSRAKDDMHHTTIAAAIRALSDTPPNMVLVPRELSDDVRRAVWRAQYEHTNKLRGHDATAERISELTEARVNDPEQRESDRAGYYALVKAAAEGKGND
jgi:hypothetical protein